VKRRESIIGMDGAGVGMTQAADVALDDNVKPGAATTATGC